MRPSMLVAPNCSNNRGVRMPRNPRATYVKRRAVGQGGFAQSHVATELRELKELNELNEVSRGNPIEM